MQKRGQLTIITIIALIIVAVIIAYFFINRTNSQANNLSPEAQSVNQFVQSCIKETAKSGIYAVGRTGGYYKIPNNFSSVNNTLPIYYLNGRSFFISKQNLENQISVYITDNLNNCTKSFENFKDLSIKGELKQVSISINQNSIVINANYPIFITKANSTSEIKEFNVNISSDLFNTYNVANETLTEYAKNSSNFCISCMEENAEKYNLSINILSFEDNEKIFIINDLNYQINNESYKFMFAAGR